MGLRNASELVYDVFSKYLNLIQPAVNDPTYYVHKKQLAKYCQDSGQKLSLYSTIEFPHNKV